MLKHTQALQTMKHIIQLTRFPIVIFAVLTLQACSYRQLYDSAREAARIECNKQAGTNPKSCSEQTRQSYDAYTQKRNEVLDTKLTQ